MNLLLFGSGLQRCFCLPRCKALGRISGSRLCRRHCIIVFVFLAQVPVFLLWTSWNLLSLVPYVPNSSDCSCTHMTKTNKTITQAVQGLNNHELIQRQVKYNNSDPFFKSWNLNKVDLCNGRIQLFDKKVLAFENVIMDPSLAKAGAQGGVEFKSIMNQNEDDEFYTIKKGYLKMYDCVLHDVNNSSRIKAILDLRGDAPHTKALQSSIEISHTGRNGTMALENLADTMSVTFAITVTRYEYANVYWVMMELYDTFLTMEFMGRTFSDTALVLLDAHPNGHLDGLFHAFSKVIRLSQFNNPVRVEQLALGFGRQFSPALDKVLTPLPLVDKFRAKVLKALEISQISTTRQERCIGKKLSLLFIWRRDYVAHPRNPSGKVARKISNEMELLNATKVSFPDYTIKDIQLDNYSIKEQLTFISNADLFVGMHGAAFGYVMMLHSGAGVLEMWPQYWGANWHMEYLAKRNGLHYRSWRNKHKENEKKSEWITKVVPSEIITILRDLTAVICKGI